MREPLLYRKDNKSVTQPGMYNTFFILQMCFIVSICDWCVAVATQWYILFLVLYYQSGFHSLLVLLLVFLKFMWLVCDCCYSITFFRSCCRIGIHYSYSCSWSCLFCGSCWSFFYFFVVVSTNTAVIVVTVVVLTSVLNITIIMMNPKIIENSSS